MSGSPHGSKRKSSAGGSRRANTKRARRTNAKGKAPDVGGAASTSSTGAHPGTAAGVASAEKDKEENETRARQRNLHGIAPDDVDDKAKPTQRAFQHHICMAAGLLTADAVLEPADDYIDHYDKHFCYIHAHTSRIQPAFLFSTGLDWSIFRASSNRLIRLSLGTGFYAMKDY
ncbi:hypothetical protein B0H13DRAFT_2372937 [Mycena leptocephala]|nr:hypothetical protein B0H13DRAFT_2372937 [Mycena leptocephala]